MARLEELGSEGVAHEGLAELLTPAPEPAQLQKAIERLERQGRIVAAGPRGDRWVAASYSGEMVGTVDLMESGDARILGPAIAPPPSSPASPGAPPSTGGPSATGRAARTERQPPLEPRFFVPERHLRGAQNGDRVLVRPAVRRSKAAETPAGEAEARPARSVRLPEARVVKIVTARFETLVGTLEAGPAGVRGRSRRRWLAPFDTRLSIDLPVSGAGDVADGDYVVVAVERHAEGGPRGRLLEVLGDPTVPGVDSEVVLRHYDIPIDFPDEVLARAGGLPADPTPADWQGRLDLRGQVVVTIDGENARDFDDAVSIERRPDGTYRLGVHIADVAHYVEEGGVVDLEAYRRGTSVYYPDRVVPMLPESLSNGLCSLRPAVPRLTMSAFLDVDRDGTVVARRFAESVIHSTRRMTYGEVRRLLEEPRPGDAAEYGPVLHALMDMRELTAVLHEARSRRGSIDFDLPEGNVELDTDGIVVGILPYERNIAHRLIEEFMIAANEAVAYELVHRGIPALYRVHDAPGRMRLEELVELLRPLGIVLDGDLDALPPEVLQGVLRQVAGRADEPFLSALVLRTLQRAVYSPECRGHYALASPYYTHFTSPIRRYPDLVVHRSLKTLLRGAPPAVAGDAADLAARLPLIAEHASFTERRAEQSERDLLQWKKVRFLAARTGERFHGRITGVQPFGLFVSLDDFHVDGLVPIRTLADDYYIFEPEAHRLVGERHRRVFQLADALDVDLVGADLRHRGLDLRIAGMPETPSRHAGNPPPRGSGAGAGAGGGRSSGRKGRGA